MLAEGVVQEFGGRVRFAVENFGDSQLARRFGISRYPAIFVGDLLVATPKDFGFFGKGEGPDVARYAPFRSADGHEHFRTDLRRSIGLVLAGDQAAARAAAAATSATAIGALPELEFLDLLGRPWTRASFGTKPVLVEFWATWCPPCRSTLQWLAALKREHGDRIAVLTFAVDSDEQVVRDVASKIGDGFTWALATPELARRFGDVSAFPTMFLFDAKGTTAGTWYGAPPTLHADVEARLRQLLQ